MTNLRTLRARFARNTGLPVSQVLTEAKILDVLNDHGVKYRDRVFDPVTTIWGFLSQVLSDDHSCRDAVSRIIAHRAESGIRVCSPNTASYCSIRKPHKNGGSSYLGEALYLWNCRAVSSMSGSGMGGPY